MEKSALRQALAAKAAQIPPNERLARDRAIAKRVLESAVYRQAGSVFIYVSTPTEPDTRAVLTHALKTGKRVYVPKCVSKTEMAAVRIRSLSELAPGTLGILEPARLPKNGPTEEIQLAVTPCVGADRAGTRLGHGAGYYDRFFAGNPGIYKLCLCYAAQLLPALPRAPHDVPMDAIVTEKEFIVIKEEL